MERKRLVGSPQSPASLGGRLRSARIRAGMNQVELAGQCGVSPSLICTVERGRTKSMRDSTLVRMARVLGCSPEWLALGTGQAKSAVSVTQFEQEVLADFRRLSTADKKAVARNVRDLLKKSGRTRAG
ncbi:helix-turn-helix domain-containing protein [Thiobacillus sedimenti]|uniref:Helix-turn-helix transcriptional regulator n=1 Tax=Thiobacillus sedimenti TaxID=3110231 RepID=A0ABZ1CIJ8_9PROT|nr:helix-turn-helix transcriptional regulator [Thiobacillus sp. SCUT-2]WRS39226.1 helix-turn-helix transcriptional regulator [Thiobacillus sp. SCUT-2]